MLGHGVAQLCVHLCRASHRSSTPCTCSFSGCSSAGSQPSTSTSAGALSVSHGRHLRLRLLHVRRRRTPHCPRAWPCIIFGSDSASLPALRAQRPGPQELCIHVARAVLPYLLPRPITLGRGVLDFDAHSKPSEGVLTPFFDSVRRRPRASRGRHILGNRRFTDSVRLRPRAWH